MAAKTASRGEAYLAFSYFHKVRDIIAANKEKIEKTADFKNSINFLVHKLKEWLGLSKYEHAEKQKT